MILRSSFPCSKRQQKILWESLFLCMFQWRKKMLVNQLQNTLALTEMPRDGSAAMFAAIEQQVQQPCSLQLDSGSEAMFAVMGQQVQQPWLLQLDNRESEYTPNKLNFFAKMHKKNKDKGEWCDRKTEKVAQKYEENMKEKLQADGTEQPSADQPSDGVEQFVIPFDPNVWLEVTCVSKINKCMDNIKIQNFRAYLVKLQLRSIVNKRVPRISLP